MTEARAAFEHVVRHPLVIAALCTLVIALAALAAAAAFVWEPASAEAAAAEAELEKQSAALREIKYRARLAQDFEVREKQVKLLETKLREAKSEPEFVRDIEALVSKAGASLTQFSSHSAERNGAISTTYFEFFLSGPYASLRQIVSELPELNEFVSIERVSLERNGPAVRAYLVLRRRQRIS